MLGRRAKLNSMGTEKKKRFQKLKRSHTTQMGRSVASLACTWKIRRNWNTSFSKPQRNIKSYLKHSRKNHYNITGTSLERARNEIKTN